MKRIYNLGDNPKISADDINIFYMANGNGEDIVFRFETIGVSVGINHEMQAYYGIALDKLIL